VFAFVACNFVVCVLMHHLICLMRGAQETKRNYDLYNNNNNNNEQCQRELGMSESVRRCFLFYAKQSSRFPQCLALKCSHSHMAAFFSLFLFLFKV
jgi:hypothetical protein